MAEIAPKEIERDGLRTLMRRGGQVVEVTPSEEYARVHIAGAVGIPLAMISRNTADRLKWDKPVIVYSENSLDDRSARAAWRLASMGFTQVFRYTAGKADWLANGLPTEGAEPRAATVGDLAVMDVPTCGRSERMRDIRERVQKEGWNTCVVVNDELVVLGLLKQTDFENADQGWPAEEAMDRDPLTFRLDVAMREAAESFQSQHVQLGLVTTTDGKLFGLLAREDVERAVFSQKPAAE